MGAGAENGEGKQLTVQPSGFVRVLVGLVSFLLRLANGGAAASVCLPTSPRRSCLSLSSPSRPSSPIGGYGGTHATAAVVIVSS